VRRIRVGLVDLAAALVGIGVGVWTSLMPYPYPPCGPYQLCIGSLAQRFTIWQSALIGGAALATILGVGATLSPDFRRVNLSVARNVARWLFEDLSSPSGSVAE
jgi:hypothetical protein